MNVLIEYIRQNMLARGYSKETLTDAFLQSEMEICIAHKHVKHSHHMDSRYLPEYREKIRLLLRYGTYSSS